MPVYPFSAATIRTTAARSKSLRLANLKHVPHDFKELQQEMDIVYDRGQERWLSVQQVIVALVFLSTAAVLVIASLL